MNPKIKPIRDLYFRLIQSTDLEGKINSQEVADALHKAELIELIPHNTRATFEHYRDLDKVMRDVGPAFEGSYIRELLDAYLGGEK